MKEVYAIFNVKSNEYFQGANPYPCFGNIEDGVVLFNSYNQAYDRMNEEYQLFPDMFKDDVLMEIKKLYEFENVKR
jgi:hypothetical protein